MEQDIFCKITKGELPSDIVWQDDDFLVIKNIHPEAPVHLLVIPKRHIEDLKDFGPDEDMFLGKMLRVCHIAAEKAGVADTGYRLIRNEGPDSEAGVAHFHIHILGGKKLGTKIVS